MAGTITPPILGVVIGAGGLGGPLDPMILGVLSAHEAKICTLVENAGRCRCGDVDLLLEPRNACAQDLRVHQESAPLRVPPGYEGGAPGGGSPSLSDPRTRGIGACHCVCAQELLGRVTALEDAGRVPLVPAMRQPDTSHGVSGAFAAPTDEARRAEAPQGPFVPTAPLRRRGIGQQLCIATISSCSRLCIDTIAPRTGQRVRRSWATT